MTCEVRIAGRTRRVSIDRLSGQPGRFRVFIDGRPHLVDAIRTGDCALSLLLAPPEKVTGTVPQHGAAASVEVGVAPGSVPGDVLVVIGGRTVTATLDGRRGGRVTEASAHADGVQTIVAPMPGRVVRVLVAVGDEVAARQPVVVVEAMKMENELRAPKAGRVKEVGAAAGTSVEAGRMLVVIE